MYTVCVYIYIYISLHFSIDPNPIYNKFTTSEYDKKYVIYKHK